jgi:hypothetical protein
MNLHGENPRINLGRPSVETRGENLEPVSHWGFKLIEKPRHRGIASREIPSLNPDHPLVGTHGEDWESIDTSGVPRTRCPDTSGFEVTKS